MRRFVILTVSSLLCLGWGIGTSAGVGARTHTDPATASVVSAVPAAVPGSFVSLNPARLLDTRGGFGAAGPVPGNGSISVQITGAAGVPATVVSAVVLNVTVTSPVGNGFITVYPEGTSTHNASNLNFLTGQTIPNLVVVPLGTNGKIRLANGSPGTTQLIADVAVYYLSGAPTAPGTFQSLNPARVLDTRGGFGAAGPVPGNGSISVQITGAAGVPATGASAVVLNFTVTSPAGNGFITVYPDGTSTPNASNLNFLTGQTIPNLVVVPLGTKGKIRLANGSPGTTQLIADVAGYYLSGAPTAPGTFQSLNPARLLHTRGRFGAAGPVPGNGSISVQITGAAGVPATGVSAVVLHVTVTSPAGYGFITVYPDGTGAPTAPGTSQSLNPARVLDTRGGFGAAGPVPANGSISVQITGAAGVPATGASAVVLNVTVTSPAGNGFITVYPDGTSTPNASNLNFLTGQTIPNLVVVPLA